MLSEKDMNKIMKPITKDEIKKEFSRVGLKNGSIVMVHTSLGKIGYVCGGAQTVIEALIEIVGAEGTIMMPTQSWKNLDPEDGVHGDIPEEYWQIIRENWPVYDKHLTPTNTSQAYTCQG
jgi:aminoglycoside 3-N-acetyltransferase